MLDDWLFLYPPQVERLWFQQKQVEAISHKRDCAFYGRTGDCGNNHRILHHTWPGKYKIATHHQRLTLGLQCHYSQSCLYLATQNLLKQCHASSTKIGDINRLKKFAPSASNNFSTETILYANSNAYFSRAARSFFSTSAYVKLLTW